MRSDVRAANPLRGEVRLTLQAQERVLRPSFEALVAAEAETGSLFLLLDRAVAGQPQLSEIAALFWHCITDKAEHQTRACFEASLVAEGLGKLLPAYRGLLSAIFGARP